MRALAALLLVVLPGCATVVGGGRTELEARVDQPPPGVAIRVNGLENGDRQVYYHPTARTALDRASAYMVIAEAPGYQAAERLIARRLSWWLVADVLIGAPFVVAGWPLNVRPFPGGPDVLTGLGAGLALGAIAIDLTTGNAWTHDQRRVALRLTKAPARP